MARTFTFGIPSLSRPTPDRLRLAFRLLLWVSAAWAMVSPSLTEIPEQALSIINKYLLLLNGLTNMSIKFFGVNVDTPDTDNPMPKG